MVGITTSKADLPQRGCLPGICTRSSIIPYTIVTAVTAAVFAPLYYGMAKGWLSSDIPGHAEILQNSLQTGRWPPHPGLHILALALLGFPASPSWKSLIIVLSGITLAALLAKHILAMRCLLSCGALIREDTPSQSEGDTTCGQPSVWRLALLTMGLCLAGPIWSPEIGWGNSYIGKFSPNLWHNPTLILAWPLMILHFMAMLKYLAGPSRRGLFYVLLCEIFSTIIKPNYTIALCGALPLTLLLPGFRSRAWLKIVILQLLVAVLVLLPQWVVLHAVDNSNVAVAPFAVVSRRSSFVPLTFLTSVAFPLTTAVALKGKALSDRAFQLAGVLFLVAAGQAYLLVESAAGRSMLDGNWFWGAHGTLFLLFLGALVVLCRTTFVERRRGPKTIACWSVFGLHVLSGMAWLTKYFLGYAYF
jgi:hypothetical protein